MEKILFKGKQSDNKEWIIWKTEQCLERTGICVDHETICLGIECRKDNKYVFEGDVIKYLSDDKIGVVKFGKYRSPTDGLETEHYGFYIDWISDFGILRKDIGFWMNHEDVEIIGNIFDNPKIICKDQAVE